jgi:hypothetical protein
MIDTIWVIIALLFHLGGHIVKLPNTGTFIATMVLITIVINHYIGKP